MRRPGFPVVLVATGLLLTGCSTSTTSAADPSSPSSTRPASGAPPASGASTPARPARLHVSTVHWRLPQPLSREAVLPAGTRRVIIAGGLVSGDASSGSTYTLDLRTGRITREPALLTPVHDTAGARLPGTRLVIGGGNATEQAVVQARGRTGWTIRGQLPSPRSDLAAVTSAGRVYIVGGYDGRSAALDEVLTSTNGRSWRVFAHLPQPVRYPGAIVARGAIWVFGGERGGGMLDSVQRIDLAGGNARVVAGLPQAVGHEAAIVLGGRILLAGGRTAEHTLTRRMWWFDPGSLRFSSAGRLPAPRADAGLAVTDGTAYLLGGETPDFSDQVVRLSWR